MCRSMPIEVCHERCNNEIDGKSKGEFAFDSEVPQFLQYLIGDKPDTKRTATEVQEKQILWGIG